MGVTINELVTNFSFNVNKSGLNDYENGIKKARNTEKQASKDRISQAEQERNKLLKDIQAIKTAKTKWLNDHNKLELKYIKEQDSIKNKINALNVKEWNTRQKLKEQENNKALKDAKTQIEYELKGYENKRKALEWLADLKAKKAAKELSDQEKIRTEQEKLNAANRKNLAEYNSKNRMAKLDALLEERRLQRQNHKEKLDQIRQERRDRLASLAETGAMLYGAKTVTDNLIVNPTKTAGNLEEVYNFLEAFGKTDAQGLKRIKSTIKSASKLGVNMPVDIGNIGIELGKAGYEERGNKKELSSLLPLIVGFARASGGEPKQAAELMTNAFSSMKITDPQKQKDMTDAMVAGLNISKLDFADFQYGFKYAAGSHAALGGGLPDLIANLAILANRGIKGSTAGTGLRTIDANTAMMMGSDMDKSLQGSRRNAKKWGRVKSSLKELGIDEKDIIDKDTGMLDTAQFFSMLKSKMTPTELKKLGKSQRFGKNQILFDLFGKTAMNAAYFLTEDTEQDRYIRDYFKKGKYRGETGRVLPMLNKGLNYQAAQANISFEFAKEAVGKQFLPIATKLLETLREITDVITNMQPKNLEWVKWLGSIALAAIGVGVAVKGIGLAVAFVTASNPLLLAASLVIGDLMSALAGGPSVLAPFVGWLGKMVGQIDYMVGGPIAWLIDKLSLLYNKVKDLMGLSGGATIIPDFGIETPVTPRKSKSSGQVPFLKGKEPIYNGLPKYITGVGGSRGGGGGGGGGGNIVTINQTIHANNNDAPRMAKVIKDVTKENLTMINSLRPQMVTP